MKADRGSSDTNHLRETMWSPNPCVRILRIYRRSFCVFVLSIGLHLHVGVCDGGADVTYSDKDGGTCKYDV